MIVGIASASPRLQVMVKRTLDLFVGGLVLAPLVNIGATDSVRCRPRTTRGGDPALVRAAMTRSPMGPRWLDHNPTRETNESSPGVPLVLHECGLEPKSDDRPNPVAGFPRLQAAEEVKESLTATH